MTIMLLIKIMLAVLITLFALIFLIIILPINLELCYSGKEFDFKIKILFFRVDSLIKRFSKRETKNAPKEKTEKDKNGEKLQSIKSASKYLKAFLASLGKIMKLIIKSLHFKKLNVKICVGSEEASKTATTFALLTAAREAILGTKLSAMTTAKKRAIAFFHDFLAKLMNLFSSLLDSLNSYIQLYAFP